MKYYFLVTYLPDISREDKKVKLGFSELLSEREHMAPGDWGQVELILLFRDIFLLEKLLSGKEVEVEDTLFGKEFWKDQIKAPKEVPQFLEDFFLTVSPEEFGPGDVNRLYQTYYDYAIQTASIPLLSEYFQFEKDLRNILAAVRARKQGLPPADYVIGSGELVEQLGQSNADDFGLGQEIPWLDQLLEAKDPLQLEDLVEQITWEYLEEKIQLNHFEFEVLVAYLLKLQMLEKRLNLSEGRGMEIVRQLEGL